VLGHRDDRRHRVGDAGEIGCRMLLVGGKPSPSLLDVAEPARARTWATGKLTPRSLTSERTSALEQGARSSLDGTTTRFRVAAGSDKIAA